MVGLYSGKKKRSRVEHDRVQARFRLHAVLWIGGVAIALYYYSAIPAPYMLLISFALFFFAPEYKYLVRSYEEYLAEWERDNPETGAMGAARETGSISRDHRGSEN